MLVSWYEQLMAAGGLQMLPMLMSLSVFVHALKETAWATKPKSVEMQSILGSR